MSDAYTGEIRLVAFKWVPVGWHACDGASLNIRDYQALFSLLTTTYGGDGVNTFQLPNLNGRVAVHQGRGQTTNNGVPGTTFPLGGHGGAETVTLSTAQVPPHNHDFQASLSDVDTPTLSPNALYGKDPNNTVTHYLNPIPSPRPTAVQLAPTLVNVAGGGQPHNNLMPGRGLQYIICLNALYPVRP